MHMPYCNHTRMCLILLTRHTRDTYENLFICTARWPKPSQVAAGAVILMTRHPLSCSKRVLNWDYILLWHCNPVKHLLRIDAYAEYNKATQNFDNYLVIYDTTPGRYRLSVKPYDKTEFSQFVNHQLWAHSVTVNAGLKVRMVVIASCRMANQWQRKIWSRERAKPFKKLVDESQNWEDVNGSIGNDYHQWCYWG